MADKSLLGLVDRNVPYTRHRKAIPDVIGRARAIATRHIRVAEPKSPVSFKRGISKEGALVVDGVGEGIGGKEEETGVSDFLGLQIEGESVIAGEALIGATVHARQA